MLHITSVNHQRGYILELSFSNGDTGLVDLKDELYGEVFEPLTDIAQFSQVYLDEEIRTITWDTGADMAPEYLHQLANGPR